MEPKFPSTSSIEKKENEKINSLEISERIKFEWRDIERDCADLAKKITSPNVLMVSIGTGGWVPSKLLKSILTKNGQNVELTTIVVGYSSLHTENEAVQLSHDLSPRTIGKMQKFILESNYELVIFDTLINTGRSIRFALEYLESLGFDSIKVATLHWEKQPKINVPVWREFYDIKPEYFSREVVTHSVNPYIEYPWDNLNE